MNNQKRVRKEVFYFKRWSRKNYAAFNSLHKLIVISVIALSCSFVTKPTRGVAQNDSSNLRKILEEVIITAEAPPEIENIDQLFLLHTLTPQNFAQSAKQSLNELLEQLPGVDIRQRGVLGVQADISFRGGNFDQTIVLLNGINFSDPQTGHYTLNLPISIDLVKKLELFKNTTAFLYGTTPFSGMVNIVTAPDTTPNFYFHLMGGMHGLYRIHSQLHWQTSHFQQLLSMEYSHSDGYIKNTDFGIVNGFFQSVGKFKSGDLEFQMGYNQKEYGANGFYSILYPEQYEETKTFLTSLRWQNKKILHFSSSIYYRLNKDCFQLVKWQAPKKNNLHFNQIGGVNFSYFFHSIIGKTTLVADVRMEKIISSSLGKLLPTPITSLNRNLSYSYGAERLFCGFSLSHQYTRNGFSAEATALGEYLPFSTQKFYFLPAFLTAYSSKNFVVNKTTTSWKLYLSASRTMRQPTFTDLYYKTGDIIGNADLLPEEAYTIESGFNFKVAKNNAKAPFLLFHVDLFQRWGNHLIDYVKYKNDDKWHAVNFTAIQFRGFDVSLRLDISELFNSSSSHYVQLQYSYLYSNKKNQDFQSRYLLDHLTNQFTITAANTIYKNLSLNVQFSYRQRKGEFTTPIEINNLTFTSYPKYCLLDIRLQYQLQKQYTLYIEATNILNQKYFDFGGLIQPGIWAKAGFQFRLY